ncbi:chorismate mutase [Falsibacillus pallidus]|uniref:chorismate mutase n=1 Tax=Falsibacillus pallidus TaxID=493781 RepID=A0A370GGT0_9BACI|nr:chorismate mutase [Falsibacillus pallidus]RDI42995.1 chorismate mutase [Falsibacillus pallidus]
MIRGVRGATTVEKNEEEHILECTRHLLLKMIEANDIKAEMVASAFISSTRDLTAAFPAKAIRESEDWRYVPVMCVQELEVEGSLKKCIRIMLHLNTAKKQSDIIHVYLNGAQILRPDLPKAEN